MALLDNSASKSNPLGGLIDLCWERIRERMCLPAFIEKEQSRLKRESVTREIADRLECVGVPAYRTDVNLSLVGLVSGESRQLTSPCNTNAFQ